jgi:hypothetical protein
MLYGAQIHIYMIACSCHYLQLVLVPRCKFIATEVNLLRGVGRVT